MSRSRCLLLIVATFVAVFFPCVVRGWVIYPHDDAQELGLSRAEPDTHLSNRKFSDTSSFYVPEVHEHLAGNHEAWLATWAPHVELGRPLGQFSGFSPAFPITRVLAWTTSDAFVLLTRFTLLTTLLAALFAFLLLEELGLAREACLGVALAFVLGPYASYWVTCVLFVSGWCWTFFLLWLVASFARAPSAWKGLGIAFGAYALLMTGYPQQIVWHVYVLVPFAIARAWRHGGEKRIAKLAGVAACALLGVACTLPVYADLALAASRSSRVGADHTFFVQTIRGITGTGEPWTFLAQLVDAFWLGNPMTEDRAFSGITLSPFLAAGVAASVLAFRRAWPWLLVVAIGIAMAFSTELYLFGVDHLGLSLSRYAPMAGALVPAAIAAAIGFDAALERAPATKPFAFAVAALVPTAFAAVRFASVEPPIAIGWAALGVAIAAATAVALARRSATTVAWIGVVCALAYGRTQLLVRPESSIAKTSPFVEELRSRVPAGTRYAGAGDPVSRLLPPNQENVLELSSIHSFNSLSSRAYQDWVARVSEVTSRTYGRQFRKLSSAALVANGELAWANVGLIASEIPLESEALERSDTFGTVTFYAPHEPPVAEAQFTAFERDTVGAWVEGTPSAAPQSFVRRGACGDDHLRFDLTPSERETLLFVSQQHHPQWRASCAGRALETIVVNGFYQGVLVPPGVASVELEFRPWALWSWIPQLLFVLAAVACAARTLSARSRATPAPLASADRS